MAQPTTRLPLKLIVRLWHDDCPDDPTSEDGWSVYSFSSRHHNSKEPGDVGFEANDDGVDAPGPDLQAKLTNGLAFLLSYFEHGQCAWSLAGEGPQCQWDTVQLAGLLVWETAEDDIGAKSYEDRRKDAQACIERYTHWCNGEVYGFTMSAVRACGECGHDKDADDEADFDLPSVGGYYPDDIDGMVIDMKDHIGSDWKNYAVSFEELHAYGVAERCKALWEPKDA